MKTIKLAYRSMWPGHNTYGKTKDFFLFTLEQQYNVVIDNANPDVLVYSVFGPIPLATEYMNPPVMIAYSGESEDCGGECDLRLGFHESNESIYRRFPHWCLYIDWDRKNVTDHPLHITNIENRHNLVTNPLDKFCNFTYRNPVKSRIEFFLELNSKRRVDSTGPLYNNTKGYLMVDKAVELQQYAFTIAFENKQMPGYVTEKLLEPLVAGSIPIYWGGSDCITDFNPSSFINVSDFESKNQLFSYIEHVYNSPQLRDTYFKEPVFLKSHYWPSKVFDWIYPSIVANRSDLIL